MRDECSHHPLILSFDLVMKKEEEKLDDPLLSLKLLNKSGKK